MRKKEELERLEAIALRISAGDAKCGICGCTEHDPCAIGCAWTPMIFQGNPLCDSCAEALMYVFGVAEMAGGTKQDPAQTLARFTAAIAEAGPAVVAELKKMRESLVVTPDAVSEYRQAVSDLSDGYSGI